MFPAFCRAALSPLPGLEPAWIGRRTGTSDYRLYKGDTCDHKMLGELWLTSGRQACSHQPWAKSQVYFPRNGSGAYKAKADPYFPKPKEQN